MKNSKTAVAVSQFIASIQMIAGIFFVLFTVVGGLGQETIDTIDIIMVLLFLVGGVLLIIASVKRKKLIKVFRKYASILSHDYGGSIEKLAITTNTPENVVVTNLKKMIDKKYFSSAYIDLETRRVIFQNQSPQTERDASRTPSTVSDAARMETITVTCKGCNGVNQGINGSVGECEYCGTSIKFT